MERSNMVINQLNSEGSQNRHWKTNRSEEEKIDDKTKTKFSVKKN